MIVDNLPYLAAFLITASIHLYWSTIPSLINQGFTDLAMDFQETRLVSAVLRVHVFATIFLVSVLCFKWASAAETRRMSL